jgi:hypothetical protein
MHQRLMASARGDGAVRPGFGLVSPSGIALGADAEEAVEGLLGDQLIAWPRAGDLGPKPTGIAPPRFTRPRSSVHNSEMRSPPEGEQREDHPAGIDVRAIGGDATLVRPAKQAARHRPRKVSLAWESTRLGATGAGSWHSSVPTLI